MFVTMLYGVLNCATHEFTYARAGHELPILCSADGRLAEPVLGHGQLLGLFADPVLDEQTVTLGAGSLLLVYTDGVIEARDEHAVAFGEERLREAVCTGLQLPAQLVCDQILEQLTTYSGTDAQRDDITLVCVLAV